MSKSFQFERFDVCVLDSDKYPYPERFPAGDGEFVSAEEAINREAVNADRIRLLEVQLKEAKQMILELSRKG